MDKFILGGGAPSGAGWIALAVMGLAYMVVRGKTRQVERRHPAGGKFLLVDGVRLHYVEQGQGPTLLLLHGNATMAEDFSLCGLVGQLARNFRVVAIDRPGYGYSERPRGRLWTPQAQARLLRGALLQLGAEPAIVLGHSWGTMVALAMALEFPASVRGLVLLSGYYYPSLRLDVPYAAIPAIPLLGDLMRFTLSPLLGRLLWPVSMRFAFSPRKIAGSFRLPPWMSLRPLSMRASAEEAALMIPAAAALRKRYGELRMPVTIMAGANDRVVSAQGQSARLHAQLPHSELLLFPAVGHMMQHLVQDDIAAQVGQLAGAAEPAPRPPAAGRAHDRAGAPLH
ncbi:pimeloyl-ACP methyl ester carboxylesterase [Janthinobacterium sp. CG_23.3]|uniref:alpha/beta fold hydrolase n=1 Tax=Janthinobacterium sp. CG_23.3 TaxID=3349634 RepID=UPI0038D3F802